MNTKYIRLFISGLAMLLAGCSKSFVDQPPYNNSVVTSQYFKTLDQCNTSTQACYRYIDYDKWYYTQHWRFLSGEAASDNAWIGNTYQSTHASYDAVAHYTLDAGNDRCEGHWVYLYKAIGIWNATIEGLQSSPIDENSKKRFIAELKFLRAWNYFDLVRNWGGVPLVLKIYPPNEHVARASTKETYDQIVADLQEAASILPRKSEYAATDKFRASKGAALALLAKTYLYMEDWANAAATAKQVIDLGDYDLEASFSDLWSYTYKNGRESIFEMQFASSQTPALPANDFNKVVNSVADGGWGYYSITSDLENAFKAEGDSIRLQWTINRHGLPVAGDPANTRFDGRPYTGLPGSVVNSKSGRYSRKRYTPKAQRPANNLYAQDDIILRFADVLLIHAEASAMQNKTADALASLQRVRSRVGLTTNTALSGWNLINAIRKERRLELAMEGDRLYDLRRWKTEDGKPYITTILGPDGSFVKYNTQVSTDFYETRNTTEPQNKGYNFNLSIHMLWPIPNSEVVSSEGIVTQNPGYH